MNALVHAFIKVAKQSDEERKRKDRERKRKERGRWGVTPQAHQLRVHERLKHAPGVLAMHGLGSGKTITSITAADQLGVPATAVVPAALRPNFYKEIKKVKPQQHFTVKSYEGFIKEPDAAGKLLIVDEGQRMRNPQSARSQALLQASESAHKRLVLSGTPIQNHPEEIAPIMNFVAGKRILPVGSTFREQYVKEKEVDPGWFARMRGVQPGVHYVINNAGELARKIRGMVDYHESEGKNFPSISHDHHEVEMDKRQARVYQHVLSNMPYSMFQKMERNLPPSKQESKQLNAFMTAARIVSNTPAPYQDGMDPLEGIARSPKLQAIHQDVKKKLAENPKHKSLVYSNYLEGGILPLAAQLEKDKIPFGMFKGGMSDKERKKVIDDYNAGRTRVLLVSGAGAEGLDLKGTRMVHLMEPHWNEGRIEQVIGRARRFGSHDHLPLQDRHVHVRTYHSILPKTFWQEQILSRLGRNKRNTSADQYLSMLSKQKQTLIDQFHGVIKDEGSRPLEQ